LAEELKQKEKEEAEAKAAQEKDDLIKKL